MDTIINYVNKCKFMRMTSGAFSLSSNKPTLMLYQIYKITQIYHINI